MRPFPIRVFPTLLTLAAALPAQAPLPGGPPPLGAPKVYAALTPAKLGLFLVDDLALAPHASRNNVYVCFAGRKSQNGQTRLGAASLDLATGALTMLTDYAGITQDGDRHPTVSHDLMCTTFWRANNICVSTRPTISGPWGPISAVTGLTPFSFAPVCTQVNGKESLLTITPAPSSRIERSSFDRTRAAAVLQATYLNTLGNTSNYWRNVLPVTDPTTHDMTSFMPILQQGFPNSGCVIFSVPGLDPTDPAYDVFGAKDNIFTSGTQVDGGTFLFTALRAGPQAPPWADNPVLLETTVLDDTDVPASGGISEFRMRGPVVDVSSAPWSSAIAFGTYSSGYKLPGFFGNDLLLEPSTMVVLPLLSIPQLSGIAKYSFLTGKLDVGSIGMQMIAVPPAGSSITAPVIGNVAMCRIRI